jgi:hypothetical protein
MAIETGRIVEVGFSDGGQGSGFLMTGRHVFTASHLSKEATRLGAPCRIRRMPAGAVGAAARKTAASKPAPPILRGKVVWVDEDLDVSIIRLDEGVGGHVAPLACARVESIQPLECFFTGFPQASDRDSRTVTGTLTFEPTSCRFDLDYHSASPLSQEQWGGVSGAMVFHGDVAVGIVRTVSRAWNKKFTATPLTLLLDEPLFQRYWEREGEAWINILGTAAAVDPAPRGTERDMASLLEWCDRTHEYRTLRSLTAPPAPGAASQPAVRLFGLAGHHDHRAIRIMPRLVSELRELGRNVKHIPITRHTDFDTIADLDAEVMVSLFRADVSDSRDVVEAMARSAKAEQWDACIVSFPIDSAALGKQKTQQRLAVAADWLKRLEGFQCPVVIALVLRWGALPRHGLLARLFGKVSSPEEEVAQAWSALAQLRDSGGASGTSSLCVLDGYQPEDLRLWVERDNVKPNLADCAHKINAQIDVWFRNRPRMNFVELDAMLSNI